MTAASHPKLTLDKRALFLALAPIIIYLASDFVLEYVGRFTAIQPFEFTSFDGHREAAARLQVIGSFLLVMAAAIASLAFAASTLRLFDGSSKKWLVGTFVGIVLVPGFIILNLQTREVQDNMDPALFCAAIDHHAVQQRPPTTTRPAPPPSTTTPSTPPTTNTSAAPPSPTVPSATVPQPPIEGRDIRIGGKCRARHFLALRLLIDIQKVALLLAIVALALGSIACLGAPSEASVKARIAIVEDQSDRLNTYLYLSAFLLVVGLYFLVALLKWPEHALPSTSLYDAHATALAIYFGVAFSILLASYYAPVAGLLSAELRRLKGPQPTSPGPPAAFKGSVQLLKIVLALGSTTLAAALTSLLSFGS